MSKLKKKLYLPILDPLETIFNNSLEEGIFPNGMKVMAEVIPLHKAKERDIRTNY